MDNEFKVCLILNDFFEDHRRKSRIFIQNFMKTVWDLEFHISEIFQLELHSFFLVCGDHYLPTKEDIRILEPYEEIRVCPYKKETLKETNIDRTPFRWVDIAKSHHTVTKAKLKEQATVSSPLKKSEKTEYNSSHMNGTTEPSQEDNTEEPVDSKTSLHTSTNTTRALTDGLEEESEADDNTQSQSINNETLVEGSVKSFQSERAYHSIGYLVNRLKSASEDGSAYVVPKRKRKRVRKSKGRKSLGDEEEKIGSETFVTPNSNVSTPRLHIHFDEKQMDGVEEVIEREEIKNIKIPEVSDKMPQIGNMVIFKVLKMSDVYTPEVSSYITGLVKKINEDGSLKMKILYGKEQLTDPQGKFYVEGDPLETEDTFNWSELIEPRIMYP